MTVGVRDDGTPDRRHVRGKTEAAREHKFKRTDLTRMWTGDGLMWGGDAPRLSKVPSPKSQIAKFPANLCRRCNNEQGQPFDAAYDKFAEYVWNNTDLLWRSRHVDMQTIYGTPWNSSVVDLARYFAKHIGCRISEGGYAVPDTLATFMDGGEMMTDVQMVLFKERARRKLERMGRRDGLDSRGLWLGPASDAVSKSRQILTMYSSTLILAHVGVLYRWEEGTTDADPLLSVPTCAVTQAASAA
ncbi:hypothetical protein [Kribbella alba]|uniref:hypothetical protein n=1 Tax=Kribbella alba TaxID=190197 RepID=UPI0031D14288